MGRRRRKNDLSELKLTPEGWVFLVVLGFITVGAVLRNVNLLIIMAGMMYAALLLNWRASIRWLKSFTASRRLPKRLHAGEIASVQWSCENRFFGTAYQALALQEDCPLDYVKILYHLISRHFQPRTPRIPLGFHL